MAFEIVGREEELASLGAFTAQAGGRAAALVLEGEAGIGKSTLWLAGVEHARATRLRVLSSRPAEAERGARARRARRSVRGRPRRRAARAVGAAGGGRSRSRSCWRTRRTSPSIRARSPSRCATRCSCSASGAARSSRSTTSSGSTRPRRARLRSRCAGSTASACSCCLPGAWSTARSGRSSSKRLGPERVERLPVGPLSVGALHRLLRDRLGTTVRAPDVAAHSRAVGREPVLRARAGPRSRRGRRPAAAALPVPETLEELVRARIAGAPGRDA